MSDPVTMAVISAGLTLASGAASVAGQAGQASAQEKQNQIQARLNREAEADNQTLLRQRAQQESAAASDQLVQNDREARAAIATARVQAGDAGIGGLSVNALLADLYGQQDRYTDSVNVNLDRTMGGLNDEARRLSRDTVSANSRLQAPTPPNYLGAAIETGAGLYGVYRDHLKISVD